jgi:hypothetical protein
MLLQKQMLKLLAMIVDWQAKPALEVTLNWDVLPSSVKVKLVGDALSFVQRVSLKT